MLVNMQFRTEVVAPQYDRKITYGDSLFFMGSCFVENIGRKLNALKFNIQTNPFGVMFNPESIRLSLARMLDGDDFTEREIFEQDGVWNSFSLHSEFASLSSEDYLRYANDALQRGRASLLQSDVLFLTWGTAWIYRHENGTVVANCHKQPASLFVRERLSVESIVDSYVEFLSRLWTKNEKLKVVLTVSPIRHWKDGAHGNQISKSVLLLAADELVNRFPDKVFYFPSYEIMMDDLRDYRFYASDMLHPNDQAVQYLWEKFVACFLSDEAKQTMMEVERVVLAVSHRAFNPNSIPHQRFVANTLEQIALLEKRCPSIDLSGERLMLTGIQL